MRRRLLAVVAVLALIPAAIAAGTSSPTPTAQTAAPDACAFNEQMREWLSHNTPSGTRQRNLDTDLTAFVADVQAYCNTTTTTTAPETTTTEAPTTSTTETPTTGTTEPPPTTTLPPDPGQFPNPDNTGVPAGWTPVETRSTTLRVTTPGAVVEDIRFLGANANLEIGAPNVTVRRVELQGGLICNAAETACSGIADGAGNNLVIEDSTFRPPPGQNYYPNSLQRVGPGGYTFRNSEIINSPEGLRAGRSPALGGIVVEDSFIGIAPPNGCGDWHGDGIQGFGGSTVVVRHSTIDMDTEANGGCGGTAPFYVGSSQTAMSVDIDGLLISGPNGNYSFRLGRPGRVLNLFIERKNTAGEPPSGWEYGPIDMTCSMVLPNWSAWIVDPVNRTDSGYQVGHIVREQPCNTETST